MIVPFLMPSITFFQFTSWVRGIVPSISEEDTGHLLGQYAEL